MWVWAKAHRAGSQDSAYRHRQLSESAVANTNYIKTNEQKNKSALIYVCVCGCILVDLYIFCIYACLCVCMLLLGCIFPCKNSLITSYKILEQDYAATTACRPDASLELMTHSVHFLVSPMWLYSFLDYKYCLFSSKSKSFHFLHFLVSPSLLTHNDCSFLYGLF